MALESDDAVVLQRLDYSETSQVLILFTRAHGKIRLLAKGIKRSTKTRFAVAAELLDIGRVVFSGRGFQRDALGTLTEWKPGLPLGGLRARLDRLYLAQYVVEITARLTEDGDPDETLFLALVRTLGEAAVSDELVPLMFWYQRVLLEQGGSWPNVDHCVGCGQAVFGEMIYFSSLEGGLVCPDCEGAYIEKRRLRPVTVQALRGEASDPTAQLGAVKTLNYHISHLMGRESKVAQRLLDWLSAASPPNHPTDGGDSVSGDR